MSAVNAPVLVTGAAGFIGAAVSHALLNRGCAVIGVDNVNAYYSPALKRARLVRLASRGGFTFHEIDIADHAGLSQIAGAREAKVIVHLAAQAGVRYSLENPFAYATSNLVGHLSVLELARHSPARPHLVYASSSSVYGTNAVAPFAEADPCAHPVSLYAATKRADELMSDAYAKLYGIAQTGLRFFTVYGPWGRPDMAYWSFAENILAGRAIKVFNNGDLKRDFTFVDDIVAGVVAIALSDRRPAGPVPHALYNIGNNRPVQLLRFIEILEGALGRTASKEFAPMQPGDVYETCADISAISRDYGFAPKTPIETGLKIFADWFVAHREAFAR